MPGKTICLLIMLFFPLFATAQNSIDKLVDELSTTGNADFTSIVQRNPKTKAIEKVVKKQPNSTKRPRQPALTGKLQL